MISAVIVNIIAVFFRFLCKTQDLSRLALINNAFLVQCDLIGWIKKISRLILPLELKLLSYHAPTICGGIFSPLPNVEFCPLL